MCIIDKTIESLINTVYPGIENRDKGTEYLIVQYSCAEMMRLIISMKQVSWKCTYTSECLFSPNTRWSCKWISALPHKFSQFTYCQWIATCKTYSKARVSNHASAKNLDPSRGLCNGTLSHTYDFESDLTTCVGLHSNFRRSEIFISQRGDRGQVGQISANIQVMRDMSSILATVNFGQLEFSVWDHNLTKIFFFFFFRISTTRGDQLLKRGGEKSVQFKPLPVPQGWGQETAELI